jgi:hypothetical protein
MRRRLSIVAIILFLLSFFIYNINLRPIGSGDTIPASLIPITLITKGTLVMDEYYQYYSSNNVVPYFFQKTPYGYVSSYPIATSLLITPFYLIPVSMFKAHSPTTAEWAFFASIAEKIAASAIAALSVAIFFFVALRLSKSQKTAIILTLAFAFGSQAWSTSSQALWMHGPGVLFILFSCLIALDHRDRPTVSKAVWFSIVLSISVLIRPTNILFAAPMYLWLCIRERRYIWAYAIPAAIFAAMLVSYNLLIFGSVRGHYALQGFTTPLIQGLAGVLFSPSRGLFLYFPIAIFALFGTLTALRDDTKDRSFFLVLIAFVASQIIFISLFNVWWGGWCYGPRYMTEIQPALLLLAIVFLEAPKHKVRKWALFLILLAWSVFIQAVGAFLYPMGDWNARPTNIDLDRGRLWDFYDNPVRRDIGGFLGLKGIIGPDHSEDVNARYHVTFKKIELSPGEVREIDVSVANTGKSIWYHIFYGRHMQVDLSYHIVGKDGRMVLWDGYRAFLPFQVKPNDTVSVRLPIRAPLDPGTYTVEISMVEEGVRWFSTDGVPPLIIEMNVK